MSFRIRALPECHLHTFYFKSLSAKHQELRTSDLKPEATSVFYQFSLKKRFVAEFDEIVSYLVHGDRANAFTIRILSAFATVFVENEVSSKSPDRLPATWMDGFNRSINSQGIFSQSRCQVQHTRAAL